MTDLKALEALLEERFTPEEVARLRAEVDRKMPAIILNQRFAMAIAAHRAANPASVSRDWGIA
jgi:hypothetical protein